LILESTEIVERKHKKTLGNLGLHIDNISKELKVVTNLSK